MNKEKCTRKTLAISDNLIVQRLRQGRRPVFARIRKGGKDEQTSLTGQSVALIIKARCEAAGMSPEAVAGHSLRRGMATTLARAGASEREIAKPGIWRQGSLVVRRYVADGGAFVDSGADLLGL